MWEVVRGLQADGVTIILTTHYIEEAEAIADRVGVINKGQILLVEETGQLMKQMGQKRLRIELSDPIDAVPDALEPYRLDRLDNGCALQFTYDTQAERTGITALLNDLQKAGLHMTDIQTQQSSLEEIFVGLVKENA